MAYETLEAPVLPDPADITKDEFKVEFEIENDVPLPKPAVKAKKEAPEIEITDDTPPADRGRKALDREVTDPTDEELQEYSDKVRGRIKDLTHARHDERRQREAAQRERDEAARVAQAILEENTKLKARVARSDDSFLTQTERLAQAEIDTAKEALRAAHSAGDTDAFVDAQLALNNAQMAMERVKRVKGATKAPLPEEAASDTVAPQPARPQAPVQADAKATAWRNQNEWFGKDHEMTSLALGVHNRLVEARYDTSSDEYYDAINARMRQVFPDKFTSEDSPDAATPPKRPPTVVAPNSRATPVRKIRLTATQVALAKRLGVSLEDYARHAAQLEH